MSKPDFDAIGEYTPYSVLGSGVDGLSFKFNVRDRHGVAIRLDPGDRLELIIQDDLSSITRIRALAKYHYTQD